MNRELYWKLIEKSMEPHAQERTIEYLVEHLRHFLKARERVLICFLEHKQGNLSWLMEQAVRRCGAEPVVWGPDRRWKTLLQQAFFSKATTIIGPPLVILGLTKLKRQSKTPLFIRKVITAGYPCLDWINEGICKGFDSVTGGCFNLGESGVVAGFACGHSWGVHIRESEYGVDIVDSSGKPVADGELGEMVLYPKGDPKLRYPMKENARKLTQVCECGSNTPRLIEMSPGNTGDPEMQRLSQYLQSWTSILDCRITKGESGLEIEIICFPGEKLPKLPTAAKLVVRPWNPKNDEPFWFVPALKNAEK